MEINNKLKQLRKQKGISQEEAAQLLDVSLSSYQKYEREKNSVTPSLEVLIKLATLYNVTTDYLLGLEPQPNPLAMLNIRDYLFGRESQLNPFAALNMRVSDEKFIEAYSQFPEYAKQIFVDIMIKLSEAAEQEKKKKKP